MTTEQMIEVMQAYVDGKQIEFKEREGVSEYHEWKLLDIVPSWDWYRFNYKVRHESTYRPYKNAEEFLQAQKEHGMYLHHDDFPEWFQLPIFVMDWKVTLSEIHNDNKVYEREVTFQRLFREFKWQDGTPCGVKEE